MASETRQLKVADLLQKIIAELLLRDLKDPKVPLVSIAAVEVSRDLSFAKVFVSILEPSGQSLGAGVLDRLNAAKGFVRQTVAKKAALRIVPEIAFVWDRTLEHGYHLSELIQRSNSSRGQVE